MTMKFLVSGVALRVLEQRYLWRDENRRIVETPEGLIRRVAGAVASAEGKNREIFVKRFYELMAAGRFLPNSPTLMNAGKHGGQLSACYVLPIEDDLSAIFKSLGDAAKVHQSGGGTGFSFSRLRPRGSAIHQGTGPASGPVSFMRIYDVATETIRQSGVRRGANMAVLRVDHPDIFEFIDSKLDFTSITNFNISVGVTDEFMDALRTNTKFSLRDPRDNRRVVREVGADELFDRVCRAAWKCGDPGLVFLDRMNLFNPTPRLGAIEGTNPCGEQPLLPYESCNLGSLNLCYYVTEGRRGFDWRALSKDVWLSVRFLDNVIDINQFPVKESRQITLKNRKIGLGVMGFADALLLLEIPYDSPKARELGELVMSYIDREAKRASAAMAEERGAFSGWRGSLWERLGYPKLRNAAVTTIAPTGTLSLIFGVSSGIEPIYSAALSRNALEGDRLSGVHPVIERVFERKGIPRSEISDKKASEVFGGAWRPAHQVSVANHVKMQAVFQRHSDSAVSKTINLPEQATTEDVKEAYLLAYRVGCKGITVYRDKSRPTQVLETACVSCVD
jgi:ribonucleoside-diphosphate reductase alpha chain